MLRYISFILLFICFGFLTNGQTQEEINSLLGNDDNEQTTTEKVKNKKNKKSKAAKEVFLEESTSKIKFKKTYKQAQVYNNIGSYLKAIELGHQLEKIAKKPKKKIKTYTVLAEAYFHLRDYELASNYYQLLVDSTKALKKEPIYLLQLADCKKYLAKYEEAITDYNSFLILIEDKTIYDKDKSWARLAIKGAEYALSLSPTEKEFIITHLNQNVNGNYADFGPEIRDNELVFSKIKNYEEDGNHLAKIYSSFKNTKGEYSIAQLFSSTINDEEAYVCNPSFTKDGETVYFSKCMMSNPLSSTCSIYRSSLEKGTWTTPLKLGTNINGANASHPQIVEENGSTTLYFSDERERGRGGKDIWMATMNEDGSFNKAQNLAYPINTRYDDIAPYYSANDQLLFFSSNGHPSIGGFDLFVAEFDGDEWLEPTNLDTPFNSSLDDYDLVWSKDMRSAYFVSNRTGVYSEQNSTCCDDIFMVQKNVQKIYLKSVLYAENASQRTAIEKANIELLNNISNEKTEFNYEGKTMLIALDPDSTYTITANHPDFKPVELSLTKILKSTEKDTIAYDFFFDERIGFDDVVIGTIYYNYDQSRLTDDAPTTLRNVVDFLTEYEQANVVVSAHTDGKGAEAYNLALSKERCEAAVNYLIAEGIDETRIIKKWYGETKPVAPNTKADGSDNPDGRAQNRRTEFKAVTMEVIH